MKKVRQRDTEPEIALRRLLHRIGVRFRVCPAGLPGHPDVANRSGKWAIFVHGCFWHGHENCRLYSVPRTNSEFWKAKVADNRARDARKEKQLVGLGFRVETVWQCEIEAGTGLEDRLRQFLETAGTGRSGAKRERP